ncbi:MAG TPA: cyclase family protein [Terriglobales bacterium]|nr:cyclase family protein [Terriglobales bacterium]
MKWKTFGIGYMLAIAIFLFGERRAATPQPAMFSAVVDLTHAAGDKTPTFDEASKDRFQARTVAQIDKDGYFARYICLPEHFGTHIDAPAHFSAGRWTVDQIPPRRLIGSLVVLDVSGKAHANPDYAVSVEDVGEWEQANGQIPPGAIVMVRTGWAARWNSEKDYRNADASGTLHFPGYSPEAARFLVEARNVVGLGIDTLSVDPGVAKTFPVHKYTSAHSVYHIENVANLSDAPEAGSMVVVAPAKIEGGSGGPVRVLALVR